MAEGNSYEAVLTMEDDQDTVFPVFPADKGDKARLKDPGRCATGDIELIERRQGTSDNVVDEQSEEETSMLATAETESFDKVQERVTAETIMNSGENPLLLAIKVTEKLRGRASRNEPDEEDFLSLADRVEEFTLRFLDPLKYENLVSRRVFSLNPQLDIILDTAIKLGQKKIFDHPIIVGLMNERWYTARGYIMKTMTPWFWMFLNIWCLFDIVLFPLSFFACLVLGWIASCVVSIFQTSRLGLARTRPFDFKMQYLYYFKIPYFVYIRDMLSYVVLVVLHFLICHELSQLEFSGLEWAILIFLFGRLLVEYKQITSTGDSGQAKLNRISLRSYFRDRWNIFDLLTLFNFFCLICPLRIATWVESDSVMNNRPVAIAAYLYGLNTMLLVFRAIGSILEVFEGPGTIQIAFFNIISDAAVVLVHIILITVAFSSAITKIFVAEISMLGENSRTNKTVCQKEGMNCWWNTTKELGYSLIQLAEGLKFFSLSDGISEALADLLYISYLLLALIILLNMLIALLSDTYQRVQDNSRKEWTFQKAVTIQTYRKYHTIPVPFNIISSFLLMFPFLQLKKVIDVSEFDGLMRKFSSVSSEEQGARSKEQWERLLNIKVGFLKDKYRLKYGDSFPSADPLDQMHEDTKTTESMVNQVLYTTFNTQQSCDKALLPVGPKAWKTHNNIIVQGSLLTCHSHTPAGKPVNFAFGARYCKAFSLRFPHFEVMILENAHAKKMSLGVVFENYGTSHRPGAAGTVGLHCCVKMLDKEEHVRGKRTTGPVAIRRGDVIRCTVMFGEEQELDGEVYVPVVFTVNGSRVKAEGSPTLIESNPYKPLYPYVSFQVEDSVLAKMCAREDVDFEDIKFQEVKSELVETKSELNTVRNELTDVKSELSEAKSKLVEVTSTLGGKLDAVLAKLGELK